MLRSLIYATGRTELHSERLRGPWVGLKKEVDKNQEFGVWHGKLEKLIQHLHGGAEQTVGYVSLEFIERPEWTFDWPREGAQTAMWRQGSLPSRLFSGPELDLEDRIHPAWVKWCLFLPLLSPWPVLACLSSLGPGLPVPLWLLRGPQL